MKSFAFLLACLTTVSPAAEYYASPTGKDSNPGTIALPFRTVQAATNRATPGDTVYLRAGTYNELVNLTCQGTPTGRISIQNYAGERPILSGAGKVVTETSNALLRLGNRNFITIRGLELTGLVTSTSDLVPCGIFVYATGANGSRGVEIRDCTVSNIRHDLNAVRTAAANAHGIAAYGYGTTPISSLVVSGNKVHTLRLGSSEAVVMNGNVNGFIISANTVWNCNNIGIDIIGCEGVCPVAAYDKARGGIVSGNLVYNIDSSLNPAYGGNFAGSFPSVAARNETRAAPGLYGDGCENVIFERNIVHSCNMGLSLSSENTGRATTGCIVRNNLIRLNHVAGIVLGGADPSNGGTVNCRVHNNTLIANDTQNFGGGSLMIQNHVSGTTIRNNVIHCAAMGPGGTPQFVLKSSSTGVFAANAIDYNIYAGASPANLEFIWQGASKISFADWQAVGQDRNSILLASLPGFVNAAAGDYRLLSTSPAKDRGDPAMRPASGEFDFANGARLVGARMDVGMDEFGP